MLRQFIIIIIIFITTGTAFGTELPGCRMNRSESIFFSDHHKKDLLTVTIKGTPCHQAILVISITQKNGAQLYRYEAPYKQHIAIQWNDPEFVKMTKAFMDNVFEKHHFSTTNKLPPWLPESKYYEENYQEIKISKKKYTDLINKKWITFSHFTYYEGWRIISFDPVTKKAMIISEGGL